MAGGRNERAPRSAAESLLLDVLKARIRSCGRTLRDLERELDLGHGTLGNLVRGRIELRFHHLEVLGRPLGFTFPEIVAEAYGLSLRAGRPAESRLRALVAEAVRAELAEFLKRCGPVRGGRGTPSPAKRGRAGEGASTRRDQPQ